MILGFSETNPTLGRAMCSRFPGPQALPWDFLMPVKEKLSDSSSCSQRSSTCRQRDAGLGPGDHLERLLPSSFREERDACVCVCVCVCVRVCVCVCVCVCLCQRV